LALRPNAMKETDGMYFMDYYMKGFKQHFLFRSLPFRDSRLPEIASQNHTGKSIASLARRCSYGYFLKPLQASQSYQTQRRNRQVLLVDKVTIACSLFFITKITRLHNPSDRGRRSTLEETEDVEALVVNIDLQHTLDGPQTRGGYRHLQGVLLHGAHELSHSDIIDSCF